MPRPIPRYDLTLQAQADLANGIVTAGELSRASGVKSVQKAWTDTRIEALYELAYLRIFAAWEMCLEAVFFRSLCGFASSAGQETVSPGKVPGGAPYFSNLASAELAVMGTGFLLWHKPARIVNLCNNYFATGPGCPQRLGTVISSHSARLTDIAAIRHRIVHTHQKDAQRNFDAATLNIAGQTFPASRPGRFLRAEDLSTSPSQRWLDVLGAELVGLVGQIV